MILRMEPTTNRRRLVCSNSISMLGIRDNLWLAVDAVRAHKLRAALTGLGLTMGEAMALGKPVIATGYSGPLDYLAADAHGLVRHTLTPVRHAFHDGGGAICVELLPSASFVECRITDNGSGAANGNHGHGLKIIVALAESLGGRVDMQFGPRGATCALIFPLSR